MCTRKIMIDLLQSWSVFVILVSTLLALIYKWSTSTFNYWKHRNVPFVQPLPLVGNIADVMTNKCNIGYLFKKFCDQHINEPFFGIFITREPVLVLNDADLVTQVNVKDFSVFNDKGFPIDSDFDMILNNLFFLKGKKWKFLRNKMSTAFTSGKLKSMYSIMHQCSLSFVNHLNKLSNSNSRLELDMKDTIEDLFTDIVCKCILGLQMHSIENPDVKYKSIQDATLKPNWRLHVKQVCQFLFPSLDKKIRICDKHIEQWFYDFAKTGVEFRTKENIQREDLFQTLINIYNENSDIDPQSEEYFGLRQLAANLFVYIVAGYETSALTVTFFFQKMALYPEIQKRVRQEILDVKKSKPNGKFEYEDFNRMTYLGMVLNEVLRMYPVLPAYFRRTIVPYKIPNSDVTLDAGTYVIIPTVGMHYNEKYWQEPYKFDPERFSEENYHLIQPGSYIPFNEGPRQCIGKRFAHLQIKSAISEILTNFEVKKTEKTVEHTEFVVGSMVMVPTERIIVHFIPRTSD